MLTLATDLDREEIDHHQIKVIATNLESYPTQPVAENSMLIVDIIVNDVNDNPPKFQYEDYAVGVSESDNLNKILLSLHADDPDLNDVVTYFILLNTIVAVGESIEEVKETAFLVNQATGALTLNFRLLSTMTGYFEFTVQARDAVDHTDEASVKIYLVSEASRVTFVFFNDVEDARRVDQQLLAGVFSRAYEASCVIDDILGSSVDGVVRAGLTDIRVHFVRNNEAIESREILQLSNFYIQAPQ